MAANDNEEVISFLKEHNLEDYTEKILNMRVHTLKELQDIERSDLQGIGMNNLEIKRFFRELQEALQLINTKPSQYSITPDQEKKNSSKQVGDLLKGKIVNFKRILSISEYKTITIKSYESMLKDLESQIENKEFDKLIPIAIYYLKCGLSFDELRTYWCYNRSPGLPRTNDGIFHLIFQKSDALVKALCIDDYSSNFPVPFYYPLMTSLTEKDEAAVFKICHEMWFNFPNCLAIASFGLGTASWSPVGKSTLLDLIFKTNFVRKDDSPYHLNSIDVQVLRNIKVDSNVAIFDCHGGVSSEIVRTLAKYVNILFIHVLQENLKEDLFTEEFLFFSKLSKPIILLVRDSTQIMNVPTAAQCQTVSIHNLKQIDIPAERLLINQFRELFKDIDPFQTVDQSLFENVMRELKDPNHLIITDSKRRIDEITNLIGKMFDIKVTGEGEKYFLSFYPIFVDYMDSHHKANHETNQKSIDKLNKQCMCLSNNLSQIRTSNVTDCFLELFSCEYSPLLIRSLSEYLKALNKVSHYKYSIDILWREALLSFKYDESRTEPEHIAFTSKLQQCLCKHLMDGEPFELIDGDNLVFYSKDIDILLQEYYKAQKEILNEYNRGKSLKLNAAPLVISILGPQNSGKSTLLNYLFGCRFVTSSGRCTKGVYGSLFQLDENINNSKTLLILDTEGLSAVERSSKKDNLIDFDRTLALFCLAVSQVVIINIIGDINAELKNLLELCAYSLTRLKVNKVALPKLFFVLNQQVDPDVEKHASSLNSLMESLELPMLMSLGESSKKISDLIQISHKQLTILPSAFNSISIDSPFCREKHNKPVKHEITEDFLMKCAELKDLIFDEIQFISHNEKQPFENVSEWIQMAGHIWETCVKYQDIVMYRGVEEIKFSQTLSDIYIKLIENEIYQKRQIFLDSLETNFKEIDQIEQIFDPKTILNEQMGKFEETYDPCRNKCKGGFQKQAGELAEFEQFKFVYEQAESNMNRLIHNILKGYEDKLKYRIKFNYLELRLAKSMKTFKNEIELRLDDYLNMSPDQKSQEFDENWMQCYHYDFEGDGNIREECFDTLYSNFKMECNFIETRQTILKLFSRHNFDMKKIISEMEKEILYNLMNVNIDRPEDWYFCTLNQSYGNLTEVQPHNKRTRCMYLSPKSLTQSQDRVNIKIFRQNSTLRDWIPKKWHPIVRSCSGDFNLYEIVWGECPEKIQILRLASKLRNPQDFTNSCWDTFLNEVREQIDILLKKDTELSQATIKLLVKDLKVSTRVVNHEIKYIRAMLSNRAERALSTLLFSYAFKVYLSNQEEQIELENAHRESKKDGLRGYFLQKIENRKMLKGDWDTKNMRANDLKISETFALNYIEAVKRYVLSSIETKVEKRIERENEALTMVKLLSEANQIIEEIVGLDPEMEIVDTDNFVIQFICNRNCLLEKLFHQRFGELEEKLNVIMHNEAKKLFAECIDLLAQQLQSLQEYFDALPEEIKETNRLYSDRNFVLCESMENATVQSKEAPFRAMSLYLSMYLNPKFSSEDFSEHFKKTFDIEKIEVKRSDQYILLEKKSGKAIRPEDFKRLESTDIFFKELIFNIYTFIENFRRILLTKSEDFTLNPDFMLQLFKRLRSHFLKDALGCDMRCPSCGKFCEKPIHNDGSKCQISNGHQLSSMGGKVWKNDAEHTAVLFMCDDYYDFMDVKLPDRAMKWRDFKSSCGSEWNWETSDDPSFEALRQAQGIRMQKIWSKFGREILQYYSTQGIHISYIPISLIEMKSISTNFYICFLIDGTGSMRKDIERARLSVTKLANEYQQRASKCHFRVVIYRDHCDEDIIETCPNDSSFSNDSDSIGTFLDGVEAEGGGDTPEAMLDGFATAITLTNWGNGKYVKNILVHIFDAPPHGDFPNYKQHRTGSDKSHCCCCNYGTLCFYDWDEHVWNPMKEKNIFYHGINTSTSYTQFESTMKGKLGEFCRDFQVCGKEQVDEAVLQIFVDFNVSKLDLSTSSLQIT